MNQRAHIRKREIDHATQCAVLALTRRNALANTPCYYVTQVQGQNHAWMSWDFPAWTEALHFARNSRQLNKTNPIYAITPDNRSWKITARTIKEQYPPDPL